MLQQRDNVVYENSNYAMNIAAVDSTFFHFFHYPVAAGEAHLDAPGDAIITQRYARNIFGKENPIGKVLEYYGKNITIKGVIGELGCKSLLRIIQIGGTLATYGYITDAHTPRCRSG